MKNRENDVPFYGKQNQHFFGFGEKFQKKFHSSYSYTLFSDFRALYL